MSTKEIGSVNAVATYDPVNEDLEDKKLDELFAQISVTDNPTPKQRSFEQIHTLHQSNRLIARAMESENHFGLMEEGRGPKLLSYEEEADHMCSPKGLYNTSCTLLVYNPEDKLHVGLYKPTGLLFNANSAQIQHISTRDSHSSCESDGTLYAVDQFKVDTLEELVDHTIHTDVLKEDRYNEINATFRLNDLEGLFISIHDENNLTMQHKKMRATMRVIQKLFEKKYHIHLPIVIYNVTTGEIKPIDSHTARADLSTLLDFYFSPGEEKKKARDELLSLLEHS